MRYPPSPEVDAYLRKFPPEIAERLTLARQAIRDSVPNPDEKLRYGLPAIMFNGRYVLHFAGWKKHIGLYPVPRLPDELEQEISAYRSGKDSVQFPHTSEVPYDLVSRVTAAILTDRNTTTK